MIPMTMWCYRQNKNKTLQQLIDEQGVENVFSGIEISEELRETIIEWYLFREVADNCRFNHYLKRLVKRYLPQYERLLEAETKNVDPTYTKYIGRVRRTHNHDDKTTNGTISTIANETADTTTNQITKATTSTDNDSSVTENSSVSGTESNDTTVNRNATNNRKGLGALLPNTTTYTSGMPSSLSWNSANNQEEVKTEDTDLTTNFGDRDFSNTTENSRNVSETNETEQNGEGRTVSNATNNVTNDTSTTNEVKGVKSGYEDDREVGYDGLVGEKLQDFWNFVTNCNSTKWFIEQLEVAFMGVL